MEMKAISILDRTPDGSLLAFDLIDVLRALGSDVLRSCWLLEGIECVGAGADEFHRLSDENVRVSGQKLIDLAASIDQMIDGECAGYLTEFTKQPWIVIRAVDSSGFDVECSKQSILRGMKAKFRNVVDL